MGKADFSDELLQVHLTKAAARLPGPSYYEALRWIHDEVTPGTYLEIGVREGASLRAARRGTKCVGVDPAPQLQGPLGPDVRIFEMTSDRFFAGISLTDIWQQEYFDLAFIDGLHLFEQALRDFINLERHATPQSIVMIHDCMPLDEVTSSRNRTTHFYSGDTWKLVFALTRWRPDLRINIIMAPPTGLCVVSNCDSASTVLSSQYENIVNSYVPWRLDDYISHQDSFPGLVDNTSQAVSHCIAILRRPVHR